MKAKNKQRRLLEKSIAVTLTSGVLLTCGMVTGFAADVKNDPEDLVERTIIINGIGGDESGSPVAEMHLAGGDTHNFNVVLIDERPDSSAALTIDNSTLNGTLKIQVGAAALTNATVGAVSMTGGTLSVAGTDNKIAGLTIEGGSVNLNGTTTISGALTIGSSVDGMGSGGTLNIGTATGKADLKVTGDFDTKTGQGTVNINNGNLRLDTATAVKTAENSLNIGDLGQVYVQYDDAVKKGTSSLNEDFGTVSGSGLLTLTDTTTNKMSLAKYKSMVSALQGVNGKLVGVSVENLTITNTENATLETDSGITNNVTGVSGLFDTVASVSGTAVTLDGTRTDLKGLEVAATSTITVGDTNATLLTLKGGCQGFALDGAGIANITLGNGSTLNLGTVAGIPTFGELSGSVMLSANTDTLNVVNGNFRVADVKGAAGTLNLNDALLQSLGGVAVTTLTANNGRLAVAGDVSVGGAATLKNGSSLTAGILTMSGNLTVGTDSDSTGGTSLVADKLNLKGNALEIDPPLGYCVHQYCRG